MKTMLPILVLLLLASLATAAVEKVVLLHGLNRTHRSMRPMAKALTKAGYRVENIRYPSRRYSIAILSELVRKLVLIHAGDADRIHFVTHSMGGILIRHIQKHNPITKIGRVVMLSPPNGGSEVVDKLGHLRLFKWINGPAGRELGTSADGTVSKLGAADFPLGVITGDRTINWCLSMMIPGKDDGKVSVESAREIAGIHDFRVLHTSHPFIMRNREAIGLAMRFLETGRFNEVP